MKRSTRVSPPQPVWPQHWQRSSTPSPPQPSPRPLVVQPLLSGTFRTALLLLACPWTSASSQGCPDSLKGALNRRRGGNSSGRYFCGAQQIPRQNLTKLLFYPVPVLCCALRRRRGASDPPSEPTSGPSPSAASLGSPLCVGRKQAKVRWFALPLLGGRWNSWFKSEERLRGRSPCLHT